MNEETFRGVSPLVLRDLWLARWGTEPVRVSALVNAGGSATNHNHYWYTMAQVLRDAGWVVRGGTRGVGVAYSLREQRKEDA